MLVLITYDVNTETSDGKRRLRKVAKICVDYGQRVQNSVFECLVDPSQLCIISDKLLKAIDESKDSLRIYNLGNGYKSRITHYGAKCAYDPEGPMIL